jgi:hypothetical protein
MPYACVPPHSLRFDMAQVESARYATVKLAGEHSGKLVAHTYREVGERSVRLDVASSTW